MTAKANPASMQIRSLANQSPFSGHLLRDASRGWKDISIHQESKKRKNHLKTLQIHG
tara:strand:- start:1189 stop:1359 length:171 start_codon:yes stop_codon:yes gene_type:complete